jgi:hypothetical protein
MPEEPTSLREADIVDSTSVWHVIDNYDMQSRHQHCSITGLPKRDSDLGVFRPSTVLSYVDLEGSYDISQIAVEEAARLLGWAPRAEIDAELAELQGKVGKLMIRVANDGKKIKRLEATVEELTP